MAFIADASRPIYGEWQFGWESGQATMVKIPAPQAESLAYFAAMGTPPSAALKARIDRCIVALKSAGVWAKLDWLSLFAWQETAQAAKVNAVAPAQFLTEVAGPITFTPGAGGGFNGNGTTQYMNSNWNPTTAPGAKFTLNSAHHGFWLAPPSTMVASVTEMGITNSRILSNGNGTTSNIRTTCGTVINFPNANSSVGHFFGNRQDAVNQSASKDGAAFITQANAPTALDNLPFFVLAYNNAGTPLAFSARRMQACHWGGGLTQAQYNALYAALAAYMA